MELAAVGVQKEHFTWNNWPLFSCIMYPAVPSNLMLLDCPEERGRKLARNSFSKLSTNMALFHRGL